jgi:hypothetical protein
LRSRSQCRTVSGVRAGSTRATKENQCKAAVRQVENAISRPFDAIRQFAFPHNTKSRPFQLSHNPLLCHPPRIVAGCSPASSWTAWCGQPRLFLWSQPIKTSPIDTRAILSHQYDHLFYVPVSLPPILQKIQTSSTTTRTR